MNSALGCSEGASGTMVWRLQLQVDSTATTIGAFIGVLRRFYFERSAHRGCVSS
ncbi:hypothetical protein HY480_03705 [Candidatus Uhrbacteria bacterium]|nr:hypothetical protein [Candidatus Uhrbacteria bacterium]